MNTNVANALMPKISAVLFSIEQLANASAYTGKATPKNDKKLPQNKDSFSLGSFFPLDTSYMCFPIDNKRNTVNNANNTIAKRKASLSIMIVKDNCTV